MDHSQHDFKVVEEQVLNHALSFIAALHRHSNATPISAANIQNFVVDISINTISEWNDTIRKDDSRNREDSIINGHGKLLQLLLEHFGDILGTNENFVEVRSFHNQTVITNIYIHLRTFS